jgi:pimeloyl-ACP methyl ester carboxylesterase
MTDGPAGPRDARAITVLVHGLWVHGMLMQLQRRYLARMGFDAVCYSYPSVRLTLTENADRLAQYARTLSAPVIHWVGHSLGGLVILRMLERAAALPPGRVVLLGSPYGRSYAGRALAGSALGARMLGRSMGEWLHMERPAQFPGREIGVIAGTLGIGLGRVFAPDLPAPNDGAVTVAETRITAACDHIELPVTHTGMVFSRRVARATGAFLRDGRFDHR